MFALQPKDHKTLKTTLFQADRLCSVKTVFTQSTFVIRHSVNNQLQSEKASTHKSAKIHTGNVFLLLVSLTFDLLTSK